MSVSLAVGPRLKRITRHCQRIRRIVANRLSGRLFVVSLWFFPVFRFPFTTTAQRHDVGVGELGSTAGFAWQDWNAVPKMTPFSVA